MEKNGGEFKKIITLSKRRRRTEEQRKNNKNFNKDKISRGTIIFKTKNKTGTPIQTTHKKTIEMKMTTKSKNK